MGVLLITNGVSQADREDLLRRSSICPNQNRFSRFTSRNLAQSRVCVALTTQVLNWRRLYVCPALR
jgi:hypothetical protein